MATDIEISRLLCLKSATQKDECEDYNLSSSMAKLHCAESAMKITTEAVQIHGGYGICKRIPRRENDERCKNHTDLRRHFRNSKNCDF